MVAPRYGKPLLHGPKSCRVAQHEKFAVKHNLRTTAAVIIIRRKGITLLTFVFNPQLNWI